jgi:hypothetical protein
MIAHPFAVGGGHVADDTQDLRLVGVDALVASRCTPSRPRGGDRWPYREHGAHDARDRRSNAARLELGGGSDPGPPRAHVPPPGSRCDRGSSRSGYPSGASPRRRRILRLHAPGRRRAHIREALRRRDAERDELAGSVARRLAGHRVTAATLRKPGACSASTTTRSAAPRAGSRREIDCTAGWWIAGRSWRWRRRTCSIRRSTDERRTQARGASARVRDLPGAHGGAAVRRAAVPRCRGAAVSRSGRLPGSRARRGRAPRQRNRR